VPNGLSGVNEAGVGLGVPRRFAYALLLLLYRRAVSDVRIAVVKIRLLAFVGLIVASLVMWLTTDQKGFMTDVRDSAADVELIELCVLSAPCETLDRGDDERLGRAIKYLSQAESKMPPTKTPISSERLVKIKTRGSKIGTFQHCFRMIEFVGAEEAYLNQIATDPECKHVDKYLPSYVAIHKFD
jgi:hypothetical protein